MRPRRLGIVRSLIKLTLSVCWGCFELANFTSCRFSTTEGHPSVCNRSVCLFRKWGHKAYTVECRWRVSFEDQRSNSGPRKGMSRIPSIYKWYPFRTTQMYIRLFIRKKRQRATSCCWVFRKQTPFWRVERQDQSGVTNPTHSIWTSVHPRIRKCLLDPVGSSNGTSI